MQVVLRTHYRDTDIATLRRTQAELTAALTRVVPGPRADLIWAHLRVIDVEIGLRASHPKPVIKPVDPELLARVREAMGAW